MSHPSLIKICFVLTFFLLLGCSEETRDKGEQKKKADQALQQEFTNFMEEKASRLPTNHKIATKQSWFVDDELAFRSFVTFESSYYIWRGFCHYHGSKPDCHFSDEKPTTEPSLSADEQNIIKNHTLLDEGSDGDIPPVVL